MLKLQTNSLLIFLNAIAVIILKQVTSVELMKGDIVVMGSDGLFDNVFDSEIISTVAERNDTTDTGNILLEQCISWKYLFGTVASN